MCGIFCTIIHNRNTFLNEIAKKSDFKNTNSQFSEFYKAFQNRGPDCYKEFVLEVSPYTVIQFAGSVLWTQGTTVVPQPFTEGDGNILLWNGDIFSGPMASEENDTKILYRKLIEASRDGLSIPAVFSLIRGPYSFIYYEKNSKTLYFGRDILGRHSLLISFLQRSITITSVASKNVQELSEVPAIGIFAYSLEKDGATPVTLYPWSHMSKSILDFPNLYLKLSQHNFHTGHFIQTYLQPTRRANKTPLASDLEMWTIQDQDYSVGELLSKLTMIDCKTRLKKAMTSLMAKSTIHILVEDLLNTLKESVRCRVEKQPQFCKNCMSLKINSAEENVVCNHSKVAILFSGGVDSAVLASLAHKCLPLAEPIDLLNVAFEKAQKYVDAKQSNKFIKQGVLPEVSFNVPDRVTGLSTLEELKIMHSERKWNFVKIDVTVEELKKEREAIISNLICPLNTVLDDSLGCALWFASRGKGLLHDSNETYTSPARIVISGIGADEQLGGYMRHRSTLKHRGGWEGLDKELQFELRRISQRNLGRDDRVVSDHGKQLRMPFLDEDVVNYLSFLPPWHRCFPVESMPPGLGDKLLLRLAAWKLGFREAANFPKRAMQFGSRIANSREKGSDISERLKNQKIAFFLQQHLQFLVPQVPYPQKYLAELKVLFLPNESLAKPAVQNLRNKKGPLPHNLQMLYLYWNVLRNINATYRHLHFRCLTAVSPNLSNIQQLSLNHIGINGILNKLNCHNCQICVNVSMSAGEWENVDALLHKRKKSGRNGWEVIEEKDDLVKLYILGQIVYNEIEGRLDDFHVSFDFPDKTDLVKILWKDGEAIGFYTLKLKDSIVFDTMEVYEMTTLDTAYVRKMYRRNGFGLSILQDIVESFPDEDIGISTPVSMNMYYVLHKFLTMNPSYKTKLWEISGVGSEGNRKLIYFSLKKIFNF